MSVTADDITRIVLGQAVETLNQAAARIRHCLAQLTDEQVWSRPHESLNSIGNLVLHLSGNIRQWITSGLGGAVDRRNRAAEFAERGPVARDDLLRTFDSSVTEACVVLRRLNTSDMLARRRIQGFDITGWEALFDAVPHFKGHQQEIIGLTRQLLKEDYQFYWQPQGVEQGAPS